jgi:ssDNA-binding Zn-finger/Zn-ribbon topoisomerase 1
MPEGKYVCPRCGSYLIWAHNGAPGTTTVLTCGNNPTASRIDFKLREIRFCSWSGICEKTHTGKIVFKDQDGSFLRKRFV